MIALQKNGPLYPSLRECREEVRTAAQAQANAAAYQAYAMIYSPHSKMRLQQIAPLQR